MKPLVGNELMKAKKYWTIWLKTASLSLQSVLATRFSSLMYVFGKFMRFILLGGFLWMMSNTIGRIGTYSAQEIWIFFLVFNMFDLIGQIFFRGIYWFRTDLISGDFDFYLLKPAHPIFQVLTKKTDFLDVPLLLLIMWLLISHTPAQPFERWGMFLGIGCLSFALIIAIHTLIAASALYSLDVENTIWIYRDISLLARIPVNVYPAVIHWLLVTILPVGIVMTAPAQALLGMVSLQAWLGMTFIVTSFLWLSFRVWNRALKHYTSASS